LTFNLFSRSQEVFIFSKKKKIKKILGETSTLHFSLNSFEKGNLIFLGFDFLVFA